METLVSILKWTLFLLLAICGTIASTEIHDMWTPHKVRNHVWTTRRADRWVTIEREAVEFFSLDRAEMRSDRLNPSILNSLSGLGHVRQKVRSAAW